MISVPGTTKALLLWYNIENYLITLSSTMYKYCVMLQWTEVAFCSSLSLGKLTKLTRMYLRMMPLLMPVIVKSKQEVYRPCPCVEMAKMCEA